MKSRSFSREPLESSTIFALALAAARVFLAAACVLLAAAAIPTLAPAQPVTVTKPKMRYGLGSLKTCAYSNDGRLIVTAGGIGAVLWDSETHEKIRILSAPGHHVYSAAFFADGETTRVLTGGIENRAILWNAVNGAEIAAVTGQSVAFSPDGTKILTGSGDLDGTDFTARLYDSGNFALVRTFIGHGDVIYAVAFSADGQKILTASADQTAKLWDVATGALIRTFSGHTSLVQTADISPDGTRVLTGSWDGAATLWNAETGSALYTWNQHGAIVRSVSFSSDGSRALTAGDDAIARIWNTSNGDLIRTLSGHALPVLCARFAPHAERVLTASEDSSAREWNTGDGSQIRLFSGHTAKVSSVAFSPDGLSVLTGGSNNIAQIWDKETGELLRSLSGHTGAVFSVAISADGQKALTGSQDKTAKLWTFPGGNLIRTFAGHQAEVSAVAFSPNGTRLITGSYDGTARIWYANSDDPASTLTGHVGYVIDAVFSPDGTKALTAGWDGAVKIWNSQTGAEIRSIPAHSFIASSARFSPDGANALSGGYDKTAKIWHTDTGVLERVFSDHTGFINAVAYAPDGARALTVGLSDPARLWATATGNPIRLFSGHTINALTGSISQDGAQVLTGGEDGLALLWDAGIHASNRRKQKLILVAGGGDYPGSQISEKTKALAHRAYRVATIRGYAEEDILYLSAFNEAGANPHLDGPASSAAIQHAVLEWAADASDLVIMLLGHARRNPSIPEWYYLVDGSREPEDLLSGSALKEILDTAQSGPDPLPHLSLLVDTVYSGGFLRKCAGPPLGTTRIILAGTSDARLANFGFEDGGLSFTGFFLTAAIQGNTLRDCFEMARISLQRLGSPHGAPQTPWMDDNGDGLYTIADGPEAARRVFGNVPALGFLLPEIEDADVRITQAGALKQMTKAAGAGASASDTQAERNLMTPASAALNVSVRVRPGPISRVRTVVQPAIIPPASEEPVVNLNVQVLARVPDRPTEWAGSVNISTGESAVQLTFIAEHEDTFGTPLYGIPVTQSLLLGAETRPDWALYE